MDFEQQHLSLCPLTGIGFRIFARRNDTWISYPNLAARDQDVAPTNDSAVKHLTGARIKGPWKSVFCSWQATMTRRASLLRCGVTEIYIVVVDLEQFQNTDGLTNRRTDGDFLSSKVLNAYSIALANNLPNLHWYGYTQGRLRGVPKEYLISKGIPQKAVLAWIPGLGSPRTINVHLGVLQVPEALACAAGGADEASIRRWIEMEVYSRIGIWDAGVAQRLSRAMCILAWDYDLDV